MNLLSQRSRLLLFLVGVFLFGSACRLQEFVVQFRSTPTAARVAAVTRTPTATATVTATDTVPPTLAPLATATAAATATPFPTPSPQPRPATLALIPTPAPTRAAIAARAPTVPPPPTQIPPTPTPEFYYKVSFSYCGPNGQTFVEGIVYENGTPKNGLLVRISQGPDGLPDPNNDDKTGSHLGRPGYYFQNIDANRPHGGTWYLWVIDPETKRRISMIAVVKTDPKRVDDTDKSAGSCQSATVDFSNQGAAATQPTALPTPTVPTPTVTGTPPTATPTGTATATPTRTPTVSPTP